MCRSPTCQSLRRQSTQSSRVQLLLGLLRRVGRHNKEETPWPRKRRQRLETLPCFLPVRLRPRRQTHRIIQQYHRIIPRSSWKKGLDEFLTSSPIWVRTNQVDALRSSMELTPSFGVCVAFVEHEVVSQYDPGWHRERALFASRVLYILQQERLQRRATSSSRVRGLRGQKVKR